MSGRLTGGGFAALDPALRYHLVNTLGWGGLRPTQEAAIGPVLAGGDALLLAPTAGGKTEAAAVPLLSRMAEEGWRGLSALYLCPLRALLNNLEPRLARYAGFVGRRAALWHGDVGAAARRRILRDPPDLLLTTPESLEAVMISARTDHAALLGGVRAVVVDELHAFAGDDRGWHILFLLERLERLVGRRIQRIGLSATVGNPDALLAWLSRGRGGSVICGSVVGRAGRAPDGELLVDQVGSVPNAVTVLANVFRGERRLVFADSRSRVEEVAAGLRGAGVRTFVSHASLSADERGQAEAAFATEPDCAIVATSTLELGLDVGDLDRVVQVGALPGIASFLQRMGRTGRRPGTSRNCLVLATGDEELLLSLGVALLWREGVVEDVVPPPRPAHLYAQQAMALVLQGAFQGGGVARPEIDRWLGSVGEEVPAADRVATLDHMLATGVLADDAGVLGMGALGEKEFGRRHFGDLVAAFSGPMLLAVHHGPHELGTVHPASLAREAGQGAPVLLLGGRSWTVRDVDWARRRVAVIPAAGGGRSRWLGGDRARPAALCRAAERVVAGADPGCALSKRAVRRLAEVRDRLPFVDGRSLPLVVEEDGRVRAWTFAGGLASSALARALAATGLRVSAWDDLSLLVRASDPAHVAAALDRMDPGEALPPLPPELGKALKFGLCLPDRLAEAVLRARNDASGDVGRLLARPVRIVRT